MAEFLIMMVVGTAAGIAVHPYGLAATVAASVLGALVAHRLLRGPRG